MKSITKKLIEKFRLYLINEEKSEATIEKYIRDIIKFRMWVSGKTLNKKTILEYKQFLIESYAPSSVNSMLSSINSFFEYNEWFDCKVKALKMQKQIFSAEDKELTKGEYQKLLEAAKQIKNQRLYYLMQTICSTGIRVSELKFITVEAVKSRQAKINCKGKVRMIWLSGELCRILLMYIKENNIKSGSVFQTRTGKPLNRSNIWSDMKKLCKLAGVSEKKVFPHNLRHPYVKLKLKILSAYFSRIFGAKVLDFPHDFKSVIGIYAHFFDKHIGKCLC